MIRCFYNDVTIYFSLHYRQEILERRLAKRQRRQDMAKRRTAAAQERMRIISQLARKEKRDDDFGMRDEDWDVYKVINRVCVNFNLLSFRAEIYNVKVVPCF